MILLPQEMEKKGIKGILKAGPLIICDPKHLPFADNSFDEIVANSVPIDCDTYLGPRYCSKELNRVCKNGYQKKCDPPHVKLDNNLEITTNE